MKASRFMSGMDADRDVKALERGQEAVDAANTDLREACRQFYWKHRSFTGPVYVQIKYLESLDPHKRDVVMTAHGYPKRLTKNV